MVYPLNSVVQWLDLSYCEYFDEWCLDRVTGEHGDSLEYLNISGCRSLDWNGLECIWRLRKLKTLVIKDMDHVKVNSQAIVFLI